MRTSQLLMLTTAGFLVAGCGEGTSEPTDASAEVVLDVVSDTTNNPDTVVTDTGVTDTGGTDTGGTDATTDGDVPALDVADGNDTTTQPDAVVVPQPGPVFTTTMGGWTMPPGQETTKCSIRKLTNTTSINVAAIRTTLAPGSHHLIIYKVADQPEQMAPFNCTPFVETLGGSAVPLMITQIPTETLALPPGVVLELEPNQTIRLEAHYLNYFPHDIDAQADVEFFTTEQTDIQKADFLFYGTTQFALAPNEAYTTDWVHLDVPNGAKVFAVTGHTHEMGTNVEVTKSTSAADPGLELYPKGATFLWDESPVTYHDPPVEFAPGDGFRFRCTWENTSSSYITFGESANKEMCFLWAYYYPSKGFRLCADGLFGCNSDG